MLLANVSISYHGLRVDPIALLALATSGLRAAWHAYQHRQSEHWPTSYGTCKLTEVTSKNDKFRLQLQYSYNVPGERFTLGGTFEKDFNTEDEAQRWTEALREQTIPVRYNPAKPASSVLWDSELENVVAGNPVSSKPTALSHHPLESWERMFFPGLILLSATGLVVSLVIHIAALAGTALVSMVGFFTLHAASILLFFPAVKASTQQGRPQSLTVAIKSWPEWLRIPAYVFFYYAILNFFLCVVFFLMQEPGYDSFQDATPTPQVIRWFSGHWMLFFLVSASMMYMRLRRGAADEVSAVNA